ncbi:hypothetical protein CPC08DRAFT_702970 [Agrocybe pediades]|nr:hypothetical protein CPC08DRAFT_702970 [Agrocybe pediades]
MSYNKRHIRCNGFRDDGIPTRRGCARSSMECGFVHPDEPAWANAIRSQGRSLGAPSNRSFSTSFSAADPARDSGWGGRSVSASHHDRADSRDSRAGPSRDSSTSNALAGSSGRQPSPARASSSAWGGGTGWGNVAAGTGWGGSDDGNTGSGWGASGTGWGSPNPGQSASAAPTQITAWANNVVPAAAAGVANDPVPVVSSDKGKGKEEEDVIMADVSSLRIPAGPSAPTVKPRISTIGPAHSWQPDPATPVLATPTSTTTSKPAYMTEAEKEATLAESRAALQKSGKPYTKGASQYVGSKGRVDLFQDILSKTFDLVVAEVLLRYAKLDDAGMKRVQLSKIYSHATFAARDKLEEARAIQSKKVEEARRARDERMKELLSLPSAVTEVKLLGADVVKERVEVWADAILGWAKDVQRLTQPKPKPEAEKKAPEANRQASPRSRVKKMMAQVNDLQQQCEALQEAVDEDRDMYISNTEAFMPPVPPLPPLPDEDGVEESQKRIDSDTNLLLVDANRLKERIKEETDLTENLATQLLELQEELEQVTQDAQRVNAICEWGDQEVAKFMQAQDAHNANIQELTDKMKELSMARPPSPGTAGEPSISIDQLSSNDIFETLRPLVLERIAIDVHPILIKLFQRVDENNDRNEKVIHGLVNDAIAQAMQLIQPGGAPQQLSTQSSSSTHT